MFAALKLTVAITAAGRICPFGMRVKEIRSGLICVREAGLSGSVEDASWDALLGPVRVLRDDAPPSLRPLLRALEARLHWRSRLEPSISEGEMPEALKSDFWRYRAQSSQPLARFFHPYGSANSALSAERTISRLAGPLLANRRRERRQNTGLGLQ